MMKMLKLIKIKKRNKKLRKMLKKYRKKIKLMIKINLLKFKNTMPKIKTRNLINKRNKIKI